VPSRQPVLRQVDRRRRTDCVAIALFHPAMKEELPPYAAAVTAHR
jgi:hypothetical protein